jgi:RNA polymerase sigma-70 factor (ECF subfamily)
MADWDRMVRLHGQMVFRTAWRILGHVADAEDVAQDVFIEASRMSDRAVWDWPGLLRRLAAFRALNRLKQRKQTVPLDGLALACAADGPEETAIGRELADRLRQAVGRLPQREAAVFCLRYFDALSNEEIAETLHISPGAAAVALHKARAKLEVLLAGVLTGEPRELST